jgi:hypothetical protein
MKNRIYVKRLSLTKQVFFPLFQALSYMIERIQRMELHGQAAGARITHMARGIPAEG